MKIDRLSYQKLIPIGAYQNERVGVEAVLDQTDDPIACMNQLKKIVNSMATVSDYTFPGVQWEEVQIARPAVETNLIRDINSCTEIKALETYKILVRNNQALKDAYDKKMVELSK